MDKLNKFIELQKGMKSFFEFQLWFNTAFFSLILLTILHFTATKLVKLGSKKFMQFYTLMLGLILSGCALAVLACYY